MSASMRKVTASTAKRPPPRAARPVPHLRIVTFSEALDRTSRHARLMLRAIQQDLGHVNFFTREDLIQLRVFSHVATITRYQEVCSAARLLVSNGSLIEKSRSDLCLPNKAAKYRADDTLAHQYLATIRKLCQAMPKGNAFTVMDVVGEWKQDQHLTVNNKRVAARGALKQFVRDELAKVINEFEYLML